MNKRQDIHDKREHSPAMYGTSMFPPFWKPMVSAILHYKVLGRTDLKMSKELKWRENDYNCYCLEGKLSRSEDNLMCPAEFWSGICALSSYDCSHIVSTSAVYAFLTESCNGTETLVAWWVKGHIRKFIVPHIPDSCHLWVLTQWWTLSHDFLSYGWGILCA